MLELKAFVQESVHALDDASLRLLSETLRVDLRGCDDRRDIERILTGLLCLDKDTALGTFLTWLRTRETHAQTGGGLIARKNAFLNTFVPVISPRKVANNNRSEPEASAVQDHHLSDEIAVRLEEIKLLEQDFKDAERHVHSGTPSFEKLKTFLVKLTRLRSKEQDVRRFFIQQSQLLTAQHAHMKEETLHTRAQLDFFVDGFTNLRRRHDELVETSTHMKAENEAAQDVFISITAQESHFGAVLHRTLLHQLDEKQVLANQLQSARDEIDKLRDKQKQLEQLVSRLKHERGDALKDASSYKLQLRKCKQKMERLAIDGPDCAFFRQQAIQLRASLTMLLGMFRESVVRDTKSAKQNLSKEVVRAVQNVLFAVPTLPASAGAKSIRVAGAALVDKNHQIARVVEKKEIAQRDVDEVVKGVVLLGGQDGEAETTAAGLCSKLRYVPVDLTQLLDQLRGNATEESQRMTTTSHPDGAMVPSRPLPLPPPTVENYLSALRNVVAQMLIDRGAKGAVFYNYELTVREANLLIGAGVPVDSVVEMKVPPTPQAVATPVSPVPATPTTAKSSVGTRDPTSPSRGGPANSTASSSRPPSKGSPSRQTSRQQPTEAKRVPMSTSVASRPTTNAASPVKPSKPKIDRKAVFNSMPQAFVQLEPVAFVEDRVDQVLEQLTKLKQREQTPVVMWDEATSQVNESLLMYAEDIHMMIWTEQENRKPKKPGQDAALKPGTPSTSSSSEASSPTRSGAAATSKAPSKAPPKGKASSPTRGSSKASSPVRSKSVSPSKAPAKPSSPAKSRASVASPSSPKRPAPSVKRKA